MNTPKIIFRVVLSWMALLAAQIVAGMMIHPKSPPNPHPLLFVLVYDALIVLPLAAAALRSDWRGWKLFPALFVVPAVISLANWIEGVWYLPNVGIDWRATLIFSMVSLAMASLLWLLVFRGAPVPEAAVSSTLPERQLMQKLWRIAMCSACYVFLYFLAGMIIFPFVRDYYATQHLPSGGQIIAMQFLVRGPMFIVVCLVLLRMFRLPHLVRCGRRRTGVHLHQWSRCLDHAQRDLPRQGPLGALLRSHQLELRVWVYRGMGVGACATGSASSAGYSLERGPKRPLKKSFVTGKCPGAKARDLFFNALRHD